MLNLTLELAADGDYCDDKRYGLFCVKPTPPYKLSFVMFELFLVWTANFCPLSIDGGNYGSVASLLLWTLTFDTEVVLLVY